MGNMQEKMKKKAIKAANVTRSDKVLQKINRGDVEALNRSMKGIAEQNRDERIASWEALRKAFLGK